MERPDAHLASAPVVVPVPAPHAGYAAATDCRGIGLAVVALGGGRTRPQDAVDFAVGLTGLAQLGDRVEAGQPLAMVHARTEAAAERAVQQVRQAYQISETAPQANPVVYRSIRP
jgi:thymidine phosphorylase